MYTVDFHLKFLGNVLEFLFSVFRRDYVIAKFIGKYDLDQFGVFLWDRNPPEYFHMRCNLLNFLKFFEGIGGGVF
jgi:hypothetical protein